MERGRLYGAAEAVWRSCPAVALKILSVALVAVFTGFAVGDDVVSEAREAANNLRTELSGATQREQAWQRLLDWPGLEQQLELGLEADPAKLTGIAEQLVRTESALDTTRARALADALQQWQTELPEISDATRAQLQAAYDDFYTWLDRSRRRAPAWRELLRAEDVESVLSDPGRLSAEEVQALAQLHAAEAAATDRGNFVALRRALRDWIIAIQQPLDDPLAQAAREAGTAYREVQPEQLSAARRELRDAVGRLQRFLDSGSAAKREGWRSFLVWDDLVGELSGDGTPTIRMLAGPYNRLDSGYPGLERKPFADVREALKTYLELLQLSETQGERADEQRQLLADDVEALDRFLAGGGEAKERGWKRFLEWESMQEELASSGPDLRVLRRIHLRYRSGEPGLQLAPFARVSRRLGKYMETLQLADSPKAVDRYVGQLEGLAQALERHAESPDNDSAADIVGRLVWLRSTGQQPTLISRIRAKYSYPNVYLDISGQFVTEQISDVVQESRPVARWFERAWVTGTASTNAVVSGQLVPSTNGAVVDIVLQGTVSTRAVGTQRKVHVSTRGTTSVSARKRLVLTEQGVMAHPAVASACTSQRTCGVQIDRRGGQRIITRIAQRKAAESRPRAEAEANREATGTITRQMDQQAAEMIHQANQQRIESAAQLRKQGIYPEAIDIRSTRQHVFVHALETAGDFLGAPGAPPVSPLCGDFTVRVHQSSVNNVLSKTYGGRMIDDRQMVEMLEEQGLEVPPELRLPNGDDAGDAAGEADDVEYEPWSITFDALLPIAVSFNQGVAKITLRGRRFTRSDQEIRERIDISATYQLAQNDRQQLELWRVGEVEADFVDTPGRLSTKQLAYKTFLLRRVSALFKDHLTLDDLPQNERSDRLRSLKLCHLDSTDGWLIMGLIADRNAADGMGLLSGG